MTWQRRICWPLSPAAGSWPGNTSLLAKTGEIAALPVLLESLPRNKIVVTTDALHRFTACTLTGQGHDYVLAVKGNQPRLRTALKALPWKNIPAHHSTITGHGGA